MASCDLDPVFVKGLKLLQSRSKESTEKLRQLYDEVVAQQKAELAAKRAADGEGDSQSSLGGNSWRTASAAKSDAAEVSRKRELEKANLEKLKQDIAQLSQEVPAKKLKLEPGSSTSASSSPRSSDTRERDRDTSTKVKVTETVKEKPRERLREIEEDIFFGPSSSVSASSRTKERERQEKEEREKQTTKQPEKKETFVPVTVTEIDSGSDTEISDSGGGDVAEDGDENDEEMQFALEFGNLSCVICKSLSVTSGNQLVECQECHSLYHQDCHKPPVLENVNDPRFVWYCYKCTKNLKKIVIKNQKKPSKPSLPTSARDSPVSKPVKSEPAQLLQPFKRLETAKPSVTKETTGTGTSAGRGLGLAGLAANFNSRASPSTSSLDLARPRSDQTSSTSRTSSSGSGRSEPSRSLASMQLESKGSATAAGWGSADRTPPVRTSSLGKGEGPKVSKPATVLPQPPGKVTPPVSVGQGGAGVTGSSSSSKMSQSTMMSADKRLQIMKKKAAAKMAEKRTR